MQKAELYLGPLAHGRPDGDGPAHGGEQAHGHAPEQASEQGEGAGASTAIPLLSACAGPSGASGAAGGGAAEEAVVRPRGDAGAAREMPEPAAGVRQGVRGSVAARVAARVAACGSWVRGLATKAIHLGRDGGRSHQGWLEIQLKKTPRPDQVKPLQLQASGSPLTRAQPHSQPQPRAQPQPQPRPSPSPSPSPSPTPSPSPSPSPSPR